MEGQLVGNMSVGLKANITMKPTSFGFRCRVAGWLCRLAAFILNGKVVIEFGMTSRITDRNGKTIAKDETVLGTATYDPRVEAGGAAKA